MSALHEQVTRLVEAGVPESEIGAFIQQYGDGQSSSLSWGDVPGEAISNVPASARRLVTDTVSTLMHPIETAKNLGGIIDSAENKVVNWISGREEGEPLTGYQKFFGLNGREDDANAVGRYFYDRYLQPDGLKQTLASDPIGALADVSTVLTGGAGVLRGGAKVASGLGGIADAVGTAARLTDPISLTASGVGTVGGKIASKLPEGLKITPERLYQSALKPSTALSPSERAQVISTGINERIAPTLAGHDKMVNIMDALGSDVGELINYRTRLEKVGAVPVSIDPNTVAQGALDFVEPRLTHSADAGLALRQADRTAGKFLDTRKAPMTAQEAQLSKIRAQLEAEKDFGKSNTTPAQDTRKALAHALRAEIEGIIPEVAPLNQRLSTLENLKKSIEPALGRAGNWDYLGLSAGLGGGGGMGYALGGPVGAAVGGAAGAIGRMPGVKANMAFLLDSLRKNQNIQPAMNLLTDMRRIGVADRRAENAYTSLPIDSVLDPEYTLRQQSASSPAKESYADMLRRYGVNITLGQ